MVLRIIIIVAGMLCYFNTTLFSISSGKEIPVQVQAYIQRAGNADTDKERLRILRKIQEVPCLNQEFRNELDTLLSAVDKWTNADDIRLWSPSYPLFKKEEGEAMFEDSPLYPVFLFYKARYVIWMALQRGSIWGNMDRRMKEFSRARSWLKQVNKAFPDNRIVNMYLGQPYPFDVKYAPVSRAPKWAIYQRASLERLTDIVLWWINNRQNEDGSYGGGWGDDVEMWRWWMPMMIAFQHPILENAQNKLSKGVLNLEQMKKGYTSHLTDVEHTAELTADAITPMMFLRPESQEWKERALRLAELMENLWTGVNRKGYLQFKSTYFSSDSVVVEPPRKACATVYETRAIQPLLLYWQQSGDQEVGQLLTSWLDGWVHAAMSKERGKPEGIIPSAVHWPDGRIGGLGEDWWEPKNYTDNPLYKWPSNAGSVINSLLLGWYMAGDEQYLEPIRKMAEIRLDYLKKVKDHPELKDSEEGSRAWLGANLTMIAAVCAKYKFLTGSDEFNELLEYAGPDNAYVQYRNNQNKEGMIESLHGMTESLRYFYPGYTSEVRWTDRVINFPYIFSEPAIYSEPISTIAPVNTRLLFSMLTGEPSSGRIFPVNAVRWMTLPRDIAALVKDSGFERFEAELFHFGKSGRKMEAELYLLNKGTYTLSLVNKKTNKVIQKKTIQVESDPVRINFVLPSRELCILQVE